MLNLLFGHRNLISKDDGGFSDPICVVYGSTPQRGERELGRTEYMMNNQSPQFRRTIVLKFLPTEEQTLVFRIYDVDALGGGEAVIAAENLLGEYTTSFRKLLEDDDNLIQGDLSTQGTIVIQAAYNAGKVNPCRPAFLEVNS